MKYIKFFSFCFLVLFVINVTNAFNQRGDLMKEDGSNWEAYSESLKTGYITGFIAGLGVAMMKFGGFEIYFQENEAIKEIYNKKWNAINLSGITVGQIKDGANSYYKEFSNRRIKLIDAIYVVKMQIEGKNPELIEAQNRFLRMKPIEISIMMENFNKVKAFSDKNGRYPTYKEVKNGDFSYEILLKAGLFVNADNEVVTLFCHGDYR